MKPCPYRHDSSIAADLCEQYRSEGMDPEAAHERAVAEAMAAEDGDESWL